MRSANAVTTINGDFDGRIVLTCEHAGSELPKPWTWPDEDLWLVPTHWACDIGADANYEGNSRALEVGVLFDRDDELAHDLVTHLQRAGFIAAPNEPYSGKEGLAYSPVLHADEFGRHALEIEARQDLIRDEAFAARLAGALQGFFS